MNQDSPTCVEGMYTMTLAYHRPLVTPVKVWTMSDAPAISSELGGVKDWVLTTVVLAAALLSQVVHPPCPEIVEPVT